MAKVRFTETALRDAHQSLLATRMRTRDMIPIAEEMEKRLRDIDKDVKVAVMGCAVNGPGEAREADIGIAGGDGWGTIFEKGVQVEKLPYDELLPALLARIERM